MVVVVLLVMAVNGSGSDGGYGDAGDSGQLRTKSVTHLLFSKEGFPDMTLLLKTSCCYTVLMCRGKATRTWSVM